MWTLTKHCLVVLALASIILMTGWKTSRSAGNQWEYKTLYTTGTHKSDEVNKLGAEGWELVSAVVVTDSVGSTQERLYFKRPR
ncbi:MAG TPA: DUF4177 domain-containing protein [Blastocatellia bacterium]|nr:DUF4177 domain-containing protein [Blastocatellia bacterium]